MSRYLTDRIVRAPRIIVSPRTRVTALTRMDRLEGRERARAAVRRPWVPDCVIEDG
jgi:hypothetical protein